MTENFSNCGSIGSMGVCKSIGSVGGGGSFSKTPMIYNDYNYMRNGKVVITFLKS